MQERRPGLRAADARKIGRQCGFHVLVTYRQIPLTHTLARVGKAWLG